MLTSLTNDPPNIIVDLKNHIIGRKILLQEFIDLCYKKYELGHDYQSPNGIAFINILHNIVVLSYEHTPNDTNITTFKLNDYIIKITCISHYDITIEVKVGDFSCTFSQTKKTYFEKEILKFLHLIGIDTGRLIVENRKLRMTSINGVDLFLKWACNRDRTRVGLCETIVGVKVA
jgi:hypothetical protein